MSSDEPTAQDSERPVQTDNSRNNSRKSSIKFGLGVLLLTTIAIVIYIYRAELKPDNLLTNLAQRQSQFETYQAEHPVLIYGIAFLIYVVVTGLSLPGAAVMSLLYAWLFRFFPALILISFASTTGATIAFLVSRYLLRDAIQARFGERLNRFNQALEREGAFYLFTLRLIVGVPFWLINLVMGLTPIKARTFWWVSQLGMLPGTIVFVSAGSSVPSLDKLAESGLSSVFTLQTVLAFALLGLFPLIVKKIMGAIRPTENVVG